MKEIFLLAQKTIYVTQTDDISMQNQFRQPMAAHTIVSFRIQISIVHEFSETFVKKYHHHELNFKEDILNAVKYDKNASATRDNTHIERSNGF